MTGTKPSRRYDLDVLRVGAFFLLILYHVGMVYAPWWWQVKSTHILPELTLPMGLLNPWRLTLLFVISGIATRFMGEKIADRRAAGQTLVKERSMRLLVPLIFGMLVIVPPQTWVQVTELRLFHGDYLSFWGRYLSADQSFGIFLPTYNHLWFVAYLWIYTMVAALLWPLLPWLDKGLAPLLKGPGLLLVPAALFAALRVWVYPNHPETIILWDDPYAHMHYLVAFTLGLGLAQMTSAWDRFVALRHWSAGLALLIAAFCVPLKFNLANGAEVGLETHILRSAYAWLVIAALFGYARRYVTKGGPTLTLLTEAVFPFYIIHQTAIVLTAYGVKRMGFPVAIEAGLIIASTALSCWSAYWLAKRTPVLRTVMGLKG